MPTLVKSDDNTLNVRVELVNLMNEGSLEPEESFAVYAIEEEHVLADDVHAVN